MKAISTVRIILKGLDGQIFLVSGFGRLYLDKYNKIRYNLTYKMKLDGTLFGIRVPSIATTDDWLVFII